MPTVLESLYVQTLDFISDLEDIQDVDIVFTLFQTYVRSFGASSLAIGQIANPIIKGKAIENFGWHDWPDEWADRYSAGDYVLHDPVAHYAVKSRSSFAWQTAREYASRFGKNIMDEASELSFTNGIAIPVLAGDYPTGLISIGFPDSLPNENQMGSLELAAIHCYTKLLDFYDVEKKDTTSLLTKREVDVLSFVAIGKSNWEISRVLGIAEHSAIQHMKNIARKLQAANRTHAVTLAIQSGQIMP